MLSIALSCVLGVLVATAGANPGLSVESLPPLPSAAPPRDDSSPLLFSLEDTRDELVYGASRRNQSIASVASAVTVLTGDRLRRFGVRTLAEAIRMAAGVHVSDDRLANRIGVRGIAILGDFNTRVLVLIDGTRITEAWAGLSPLGYDLPLTISDVERIEVVRGPASSVYGTNAFVGVINVITKSVTDRKAWAQVGGSTRPLGTGAAGFALGNAARSVRMSVSGLLRGSETLAADGVGTNLSNDDQQQLTGSLIAVHDDLFLQVRALRHTRASPFAPYESDVSEADPYTSSNTQLVVDGGISKIVSSALSYSAHVWGNRYRFSDLAKKAIESDLQTIGDATTLGGEARLRGQLLPKNRLSVTVGSELQFHQTKSRAISIDDTSADGRVVTVPADFTTLAAYLEAESQLFRNARFVGGFRFDSHSNYGVRVSPRLALLLSRGNRAGLKLIYSEGFRSPTMFEGRFEDRVDFIANKNLNNEVIRAAELALWARRTIERETRSPLRGSLRGSLFYWRATDLIDQQPFAGNPSLLQFQNVGSRRSIGAELEATLRTTSGWLAYAHTTYAKVLDLAGNDVSNVPALVGAVGVSTKPVNVFAASLVTSLDASWISSRLTRDPNRQVPAYVGLNATVLATLGVAQLSLSGRNLLNVESMPAPDDYARGDAGDAIVPIIPGEGRELYVSIEVKH